MTPTVTLSVDPQRQGPSQAQVTPPLRPRPQGSLSASRSDTRATSTTPAPPPPRPRSRRPLLPPACVCSLLSGSVPRLPTSAPRLAPTLHPDFGRATLCFVPDLSASPSCRGSPLAGLEVTPGAPSSPGHPSPRRITSLFSLLRPPTYQYPLPDREALPFFRGPKSRPSSLPPAAARRGLQEQRPAVEEVLRPLHLPPPRVPPTRGASAGRPPLYRRARGGGSGRRARREWSVFIVEGGAGHECGTGTAGALRPPGPGPNHQNRGRGRERDDCRVAA